MQENSKEKARDNRIAKVKKLRKLSPIWIIPIVTAFIGLWVVIYHLTTQGPIITLITTNAEDIVGGKTAIKSRSVDIGIVQSVTLSEDLSRVEITARLHSNMKKLLKEDSVFWVVKPQIGHNGVSGLGTLLSGVYIELRPGVSKESAREFNLLDSPPLTSLDVKGLRIHLESKQSNVINSGSPVLFRGMRVGTVESNYFDTEKRLMKYQLFIMSPFDSLITSNVRFWQDSGFTVDMSAQGVSFGMSSIQTLLGGGVTFDVPEGWEYGEQAKSETVFELYPDKASILDSIYTQHEYFILLFKESIRGLNKGAPVEFRGIRIGTVIEAPHYIDGMWNMTKNGFYIPVLIRIEAGRIQNNFPENDKSLRDRFAYAQSLGLRASLKSGNLLTGSLYVDFDFYNNPEPWAEPSLKYDYPVLASVSGGLAQLQQKLMLTLDKINSLPLNNLVVDMSNTLKEGQEMIKSMNQAMLSLDKILASPNAQALPKDLQKTLNELNKTLKGVQPGSVAYNKLVDDMKRLDDVLREIQPLAKTLNEKSNALVFESGGKTDPEPKRSKK